MKPLILRSLTIAAMAVISMTATSCTMLQEIGALRQVNFDFDRVSQTRLAGVNVDNVRSYENLGPMDAGRIATAVASQRMPLSFQLHLAAENPSQNSRARLVRMDWTLFLAGTETVSGIFDSPRVIEPGQTADIPIAIELDLMRFFGNNVRDLVDLALAVSGQPGHQTEVTLRFQPTIETSLGPMRYPTPITVTRRVGN